jgi:hypothetical protein
MVIDEFTDLFEINEEEINQQEIIATIEVKNESQQQEE